MSNAIKKAMVQAVSYIDTEFFVRIAISGGLAESAALKRLSVELEHATDEDTIESITATAEDEAYYKKELSHYACILALIALYHASEVKRARMLNIATGKSDNLHKINDFKDALAEFGITHNQIAQCDDLEELRQLVNNFKHSGLKVGGQLDGFLSYKLNDEINIAENDVARFSRSAVIYMKDLATRLNSRIHP